MRLCGRRRRRSGRIVHGVPGAGRASLLRVFEMEWLWFLVFRLRISSCGLRFLRIYIGGACDSIPSRNGEGYDEESKLCCTLVQLACVEEGCTFAIPHVTSSVLTFWWQTISSGKTSGQKEGHAKDSAIMPPRKRRRIASEGAVPVARTASTSARTPSPPPTDVAENGEGDKKNGESMSYLRRMILGKLESTYEEAQRR